MARTHQHRAWQLLVGALMATWSLWPAQAAGPAATAPSVADAVAIRQVLMATFDKPEARLRVEPVVSVGDHAVADWVQGERGGRALTLRRAGQWQVQACGGAALSRARTLQDAGVPAAVARHIASALTTAEAALPPATRARLDSFDATVPMSSNAQHPQHAAPGTRQHAPASSPIHRH